MSPVFNIGCVPGATVLTERSSRRTTDFVDSINPLSAWGVDLDAGDGNGNLKTSLVDVRVSAPPVMPA